MTDWIAQNWQTVTAGAGAVVMIARIVVRLTPTQADDSFLAKYVIPVLKTLGLKID